MPDHPLSTMRKLDPDFMKRVDDTDALIYCDGALPRRIKLLIAMAFDAANGAPGAGEVPTDPKTGFAVAGTPVGPPIIQIGNEAGFLVSETTHPNGLRG